MTFCAGHDWLKIGSEDGSGRFNFIYGILEQWPARNLLFAIVLMQVNPYQSSDLHDTDRNLRNRRFFAYGHLSLLIYIVSFFMPVFDSGTPQVMYDYQAFLFSIVSQYLPCWLANPIYWIACHRVLTCSSKGTRTYGIAAVVVSVSQVWMLDDVPELGFYMWVGSMAFLAVGTIAAGHSQRPEPKRL